MAACILPFKGESGYFPFRLPNGATLTSHAARPGFSGRLINLLRREFIYLFPRYVTAGAVCLPFLVEVHYGFVFTLVEAHSRRQSGSSSLPPGSSTSVHVVLVGTALEFPSGLGVCLLVALRAG